MSFSKENNDDIKRAPWVEVTISGANERIDDESERLLDIEPTAEAIPCVEAKQMDRNNETTDEDYPQAKVVASGAAGCIFGCLIGGVACAIAGGLGSAYAAKHKAGTCLGDTARAMGEVTTIAHAKAVEVDQKHNVVKTTQEAAQATLEKAKAMDQEYLICERSKKAIISTGQATIDFAARHRLVERSVKGLERALEYMGTRNAISPPTTSHPV